MGRLAARGRSSLWRSVVGRVEVLPGLMPMRLFNTLTRSEEELGPADGKTVRMYTCGLTVYARGHIGNFRTFVTLDALRRALKYQEGYGVKQVMNFTDVDDKTISASQKTHLSLRDYTNRYVT